MNCDGTVDIEYRQADGINHNDTKWNCGLGLSRVGLVWVSTLVYIIKWAGSTFEEKEDAEKEVETRHYTTEVVGEEVETRHCTTEVVGCHMLRFLLPLRM